ncbi:MAG: hypothetical protein HY267_03485 [Deltaproteobacteria bacterium]|nr:hypothetical protein [Deltaproteobacteria bacterium]
MAHAESDGVLYALLRTPLFDGQFGKLAEVQTAISAALTRCGRAPIAVDGKFGNTTSQAVKALIACPEIESHIPPESSAHQGAITQSVWRALLPNSALPSVEERAQTVVLTYEATDYDRLEWNFCQNRPLWSPQNPSMPCFTNDPGSYITWGPRGATAGHGREVQWILWRVDQRDASIVDTVFGADAARLRKLISLNDSSARYLLCSIYADESQRASWTRAFKELGKSALVRFMYELHYLSRTSDGAKMATLYRLYDKLGVKPTEVDYAFFLDRATHSSPPSDLDSAARKIQGWLEEKGATRTPSNMRRAFAAKFPTANQKQDRLGRDVAFFIDAVSESGLTQEERQAWRQRGQLSAANVGLSDEREAPALNPVSDANGPSFGESLEPAPPCPQSVLNPRTASSH